MYRILFPFTLLGLVSCPASVPADGATGGTVLDQSPARLGETCYLHRVVGEDGVTVDSLILRYTYDGVQIRGTYHWVPYESDAIRGTISGVLRNDTLTTLYAYTAEGERATEEKLFVVHDKEVVLLEGELEDRDGVWRLKDRSTAMPVMSIPSVDCW